MPTRGSNRTGSCLASSFYVILTFEVRVEEKRYCVLYKGKRNSDNAECHIQVKNDIYEGE